MVVIMVVTALPKNGQASAYDRLNSRAKIRTRLIHIPLCLVHQWRAFSGFVQGQVLHNVPDDVSRQSLHERRHGLNEGVLLTATQ